MASTVNFTLLAKLLKAKRANRVLRNVAADIGAVSPSTLSRIEGERLKDVTTSTLLHLCDWLEINPSHLIVDAGVNKPAAPDLPARVELELRNSAVDERSARVLAAAFEAGYEVALEK